VAGPGTPTTQQNFVFDNVSISLYNLFIVVKTAVKANKMYENQQIPFVRLTTDATGTKMYFIRELESGEEVTVSECNLPFFSSVLPKSMKRRYQVVRRIFRSIGQPAYFA
jgi:hypothetical protein